MTTEDGITLDQGSATPATGAESEHPSAVLWVPDPEKRYLWREYYVYPKRGDAPKKVGFRRD